MTSNDNDPIDQKMERTLREYFAAESDELRAPEGMWQRLEQRLAEYPRRPSWFGRMLRRWGWIGTGWNPAFAAAAIGVVAISAVWMVTSNPFDDAPGSSSPTGLISGKGSGSVTESGGQPLPSVLSIPSSAAPNQKDSAPSYSAPMSEPSSSGGGSYGGTASTGAATTSSADAGWDSQVTENETGASHKEGWASVPVPSPTVGGEVRGGTRPGATTFQDFGRIPTVSTSQDAVSTFSLDADRTSYYLALNWARSGYEIAPESVRAEEWVNAFDYEYDPPADDWGFAISSAVMGHPFDEQMVLARIAFQAANVAPSAPLNVTLVLDASGSMRQGDREAIARAAAEAIRRSLTSRDRIAVVHFTDDVIDRLTVRHSGPDDNSVVQSISRLEPHGSTNVQAGLNLGVRLANDARDANPEAHNYIVLMSDGVANVDATNPFEILESAYDPDSKNPLRLITVGVGIENYNDYLLEQLAQHGNGWYRYLNTTEQASATFRRENWVMLSTPFADQTRAQVTWDASVVKSWRIVGYENRVTPDETFAQDRKEFAEIYSGAATTVFYELELHDPSAGLRLGPLDLGDVALRWVVPDSGRSREQQVDVWAWREAGTPGLDAPLLKFGGIVALAADRYSSLSHGRDFWRVSRELSVLSEEVQRLQPQLGNLDGYRDFVFLLDHIAKTVEVKAPPDPPSGYSP